MSQQLARVLFLLALQAISAFGAVSRVKDLAALEGVRDNQLVGYGLVVGLNGTGDKRQTVFAAQSLANMLNRMGVAVNPTAMQAKNVAAVMVTATLPPFAQPGTKIDTTVATIGDASNLQGGQLLLTSLRGADGQVYAVAQGGVLTAGFIAGRAGNSQTVNHPTAGRVPSGGIVEQAAPLRNHRRPPPVATPAGRLHNRHAAGRRDQQQVRPRPAAGGQSLQRWRRRSGDTSRMEGSAC